MLASMVSAAKLTTAGHACSMFVTTALPENTVKLELLQNQGARLAKKERLAVRWPPRLAPYVVPVITQQIL